MKRFFINENLNENTRTYITGTEHNHIKNVLRLKVGDEIILVCGDDYDYLAKIVDMSKGQTTVDIVSKSQNTYNSNSNVTVFQALVKSENMALIVQKLTELGVKDFVPFMSEFITSKDKFNKCQKLQEISNQSIKQCKRSKPMNVSSVLTFKQVCQKLSEYDVIIFANECEKTSDLNNLKLNSNQKIAIIIGSEGGFSTQEIESLINAGATSISMGNRILRAETASISLTAVVMFLIGEWKYV